MRIGVASFSSSFFSSLHLFNEWNYRGARKSVHTTHINVFKSYSKHSYKWTSSYEKKFVRTKFVCTFSRLYILSTGGWQSFVWWKWLLSCFDKQMCPTTHNTKAAFVCIEILNALFVMEHTNRAVACVLIISTCELNTKKWRAHCKAICL